MKKYIIISDSFKGTLSSVQICEIAKKVFERTVPKCELITLPVADGGEGTVDCFSRALGCRKVKVNTTGPYGEDLVAEFALHEDSAFFEIASVAGLPLVGTRKNPSLTTSYGMGKLIYDAIAQGARRLVLGLGGSATNDGGCGLAAALGTKFYNTVGESFVPVGETLKDISRIECSETKEMLEGMEIIAMCDVNNPLYGPKGAAHIYGPQKGADSEMVKSLDEGLRHLAELIHRDVGVDVSQLEGAGAAGGLGGGIVAFMGGTLQAGIDTVLDTVDFSKRLEGCELVITGEGRLDTQSAMGKVIDGVLRVTSKAQVPTVALVGGIDTELRQFYDMGLTAAFSISQKPMTFEHAKKLSAVNYEKTLENVLRLFKAKI